ncbi:MAG: polysaccharide biosynthesis protein, partial [Clostridia bacterium]|nr:polysaccharide biosynthesis protein [Clostridia bacterium]
MANRKISSFKNVVFGIIYQVTNLILSFVCRTLLIYKLGSEILGINSLYSNILTLFSLAELGISNVMLIKLYKPIANGDKEQITAYVTYYKKIYSVIALIICAIGLLFVPFLHLIVSTDITITNADLIIYYLIFLTNTVFSYLLVYKQTLLNANQEFYILKLFGFFSIIIKSTIAVLTLIIYP